MLAALALAAAAPTGPAVLIVKTSAGYQFAHFSSFDRCEAARLRILADRQATSDEYARRGMRIIVPAEFAAKCVAG